MCLLLFWFTSLSVLSQSPTLTMLNSGPQPGDVFISYYADTTGVGFGAAGTNQVWDFSNLVVDTLVHYEFYVSPNSSLIPAATGAYTNGGTHFTYLNVNESGESILGESDQIPYSVPVYSMIYSDPVILLTYPFKYPDSIYNTVAGIIPPYLESGSRKGTSSTTADGYGILRLPAGIFNNVLRVKIIQDFRDSILTGTPPVTSFKITHYEEYHWYDGVHKTPVFEILKSLISVNDTFFSGKAVLLGKGLNGISDGNEIGMTFDLYPNPAINRINLNFNLGKKSFAEFSILTTTGTEVLKDKAVWFDAGQHNRSINVSSLSRGLYLVRCITSYGSTFRKLCLN